MANTCGRVRAHDADRSRRGFAVSNITVDEPGMDGAVMATGESATSTTHGA